MSENNTYNVCGLQQGIHSVANAKAIKRALPVISFSDKPTELYIPFNPNHSLEKESPAGGEEFRIVQLDKQASGVRLPEPLPIRLPEDSLYLFQNSAVEQMDRTGCLFPNQLIRMEDGSFLTHLPEMDFLQLQTSWGKHLKASAESFAAEKFTPETVDQFHTMLTLLSDIAGDTTVSLPALMNFMSYQKTQES